MMQGRPRELLGAAIAAFAFAAILAATALPSSDPEVDGPLWCLRCIVLDDAAAADFLLNFALYGPLGFGLRLLGLRSMVVVAALLASTLSIETLQVDLIPGRVASALDVLANMLGGSIGIAVASNWRALATPVPGEARALAALWAGLVTVLMALTSLALAPSFPATDYALQWRAKKKAGRDGVLLSVRAAGQLLPEGPISRERVISRLLSGKEIELRAVGHATERPYPAIRLATQDTFYHLIAGQRRRDAVLEVRMRAADARFPFPILRLRNALAPSADDASAVRDSFRITARIRTDALALAVERPDRRLGHELRLSPFIGWAVIAPVDYPSAAWPALTALWLTALLFPLGYWTARGARAESLGGDLIATVPAALVAVAMVALPARFELAAATALEWAVATIAFTAGFAIGYQRLRGERHRPSAEPGNVGAHHHRSPRVSTM